MNYLFHIFVVLLIYTLLALSTRQQIGLSGLLNMAQATFYGIGAYTSAIIMTRLGMSYWSALAAAILASTSAALLISVIADKVTELYFGLATLSLQIIFSSCIYNWTTLTGGPFGISSIAAPSIGAIRIQSPESFALFGMAWVTLVMIFYKRFAKTVTYKMIMATRDNQLAVLTLGKNPNYYKRISIIISAIIAGIAGTLYASYITYIDPSSFTLDESILLLSIVLIGGSGNIWGAVTGATIYTLLPELLKLLHIPDQSAANLRMVLFGILLLLILRYKPKGIFGNYSIK